MGMTRSAIGMYETGKREPDLETLEAFADYYNVDMNTLTGSLYDAARDAVYFKEFNELTDEQKARAVAYAQNVKKEEPPAPGGGLSIFDQLTSENQARATSYLEFLLAEQQKDQT